MNNLIKELKNAIAKEKGTSAYDTDAKVVRIDGTTAWVHIPGGVEETPVNMSINARTGDMVRVRVENGGAYLLGNMTSPPTDDHLAKNAEDKAIQAESAAGIAKQAAEIAAIESQEAQKKAKKVEDEQRKYGRTKILSQNGKYRGHFLIHRKKFNIAPSFYCVNVNVNVPYKSSKCPYNLRLFHVENGIKKTFNSLRILWDSNESRSLLGKYYSTKNAAEQAITDFKNTNTPIHPSFSMNDVALFVNKSDSEYVIRPYPNVLGYPGRVGRDYEVYCTVGKYNSGYFINVDSYCNNDNPDSIENYVLSKSSTKKLVAEYDVDVEEPVKAVEFGENATAYTGDVAVFGSYNEETSDDDAAVFGNGTESFKQTAMSIKRNGDIITNNRIYADDFLITKNKLKFTDVIHEVGKLINNKPLLVTEAFDSDFMSFTAGTIGTRGAQKKISIAKNGYNPILVTIFYIASSVSCHPLVFFNEDRDAVYVNLYRATNKSYGSENPVRFLVTYMRKG